QDFARAERSSSGPTGESAAAGGVEGTHAEVAKRVWRRLICLEAVNVRIRAGTALGGQVDAVDRLCDVEASLAADLEEIAALIGRIVVELDEEAVGVNANDFQIRRLGRNVGLAADDVERIAADDE